MHSLPFDVKNLLLLSNEDIFFYFQVCEDREGVSRKFRDSVTGKKN